MTLHKITNATPHPVAELVLALSLLGPYPPGVREVPHDRRISGHAFFPGGHGLWAATSNGTLPHLPSRPVMVVGNNWGTVADHAAAFAAGAERPSDPTWANLLAILNGAGIPPEQCFFTNAYMGLMEASSNLAEFPGLTDVAFTARCREFLALQIRAIRPAVLVAMGAVAIDMLAAVVPGLRPWRGPRGGRIPIVEIHRRGSGVLGPLHIEGDPAGAEFKAVAINHTCDRRNLSPGFAREVELIRHAAARTSNAGGQRHTDSGIRIS